MTEPSNPSDEELSALIDGALGEGECLRIEALLESNPDRLRRFEAITGYEQFRESFLKEAPERSPVRSEVLVDLVGKLKAGDFSRQTPDAEALDALDSPPSGGEPGRLGEFEVLDVIACGGMGMVFRARDPQLDRLVAIKALAPRFAKDAEARGRFLKEARLVAALDHPNILPIYAVAEGEKVPYFVMRLVEGETLAELVARDGPLARKRALQIALQVARALAAAHEAQVIHRDVKPANLLIENGSGRVWVADFGIAKHNHGDSGEASGTPAFAAPEQLEGAPPSVASDLYGLGATLCFALSGKPPVDGGLLPKRLASLLHANPEGRPSSAQDAVRLLKRSLRSTLPRRLACVAVGIVAVLALISSLTPLGLAGWCNRVAGGGNYFIDGDFGTFPDLGSALAAAGDGDVVLVDYDGEIGLLPTIVTKPLTIRAAPGRRPAFVQKVIGKPMLELRAPTTLDGLTLIRPPVQGRPNPVVAVMFSKLILKSCTLIALQDEHLAINAPLFCYGMPDIEIRDCIILTGQVRWFNLVARATTKTRQRGSLQISNSCILAKRGANLVCENTDVDIVLRNVTSLGSDLFALQTPGGKCAFDVRDSILVASKSVLWSYAGVEVEKTTPRSQPAVVDWKGSGNLYASGQPGFLRYLENEATTHGHHDFINEIEPGIISLQPNWFTASTVEDLREQCARWLEAARPTLRANQTKGADLSRIENFSKNR